MSQFRFEPRGAADLSPALKPADCPPVADLIEYADGHLNDADRQRVENHLQATGCSHCRRWVAKVIAAGPPPSFAPSPTSDTQANRARASTDPQQWQQQAFIDLEKRLRDLDDG